MVGYPSGRTTIQSTKTKLNTHAHFEYCRLTKSEIEVSREANDYGYGGNNSYLLGQSLKYIVLPTDIENLDLAAISSRIHPSGSREEISSDYRTMLTDQISVYPSASSYEAVSKINFSYDGEGRLVESREAKNPNSYDYYEASDPSQFISTVYTYSGGLLSSIKAPGGTKNFLYNAQGELAGFTAPGQSVNYFYSAQGLKLKSIDNLKMSFTEYAYDSKCQLAAKNTPFGTTSYKVREDGRPSEIKVRGIETLDKSYSYDDSRGLQKLL